MSNTPTPPAAGAPAGSAPAGGPLAGTPAPATPPAAPNGAPVAPPGVALISIDDFGKVKLATAEVVSAEPHPKADRLLILNLKVGEKTKRIVSGIREFYSPEQMVGKTIVIVDNLQPAKLRGEVSEGMLLAVRLPEGGLRLLTTDAPAPSGLSVS